MFSRCRDPNLNLFPAPVPWTVLTAQEGASALPRKAMKGPEWQAPRHPDVEQRPRQRRPQTPAQSLAVPSKPVLPTEDKAPTLPLEGHRDHLVCRTDDEVSRERPQH